MKAGQGAADTTLPEGGIQVKDTSGSPGWKVNMMVKKNNGSSNEISPKLKAAREIDPNFPESWNFFAKPDDKIAKIK